MSVEVPAQPVPRINRRSGADESWEDVPYVVVPPFTARPIAHLAVEVSGFLPTRQWGDTSMVYVRTRCGRKDLYADRRNGSWSRLCKRCFPSNQQVRE